MSGAIPPLPNTPLWRGVQSTGTTSPFVYVHTRPVSPGFVQQIMPNTYILPIDTTAAQTFELSYAWPPPGLSLLYFLCWTSLWSTLQTFTYSWFCMTSVRCLHSCVTKSYIYGILNATCKSRVGVRLGKLSLVRKTSFCRHYNCKRWLSTANSKAGQA
jgi:hypothetical protein